jgi:hypothetical protein
MSHHLGTPLNPSVAQVLAALAYHHTHQTSFPSLTAPEHPARTVYVLGTPLNPSVAQVLAALAYHHPHQTVPFMKALLSTAAHIMKVTERSGLERLISNNTVCLGCQICYIVAG